MPKRRKKPAVPAPLVWVATGIVLAGTLVGCGGSDQPQASDSATATPTPIASLKTSSMRLARIDFCDLVGDDVVAKTLGGAASDSSSWGNGDRTSVGGSRDVVHEFGCAWTGQDRTASAWVFARPVTTSFARSVVRKGATRAGCRIVDGPAFGSPSQQQLCKLGDGTRRVRISGLFADTWLSCQLSGSKTDSFADLTPALGRWCVAVAGQLDTSD